MLTAVLLGCSHANTRPGAAAQDPAQADAAGRIGVVPQTGIAGSISNRPELPLDGGSKADPRDAQISVVPDAKVPPEVVPPVEDPADCKLTALTPAEACPSADCALAFAGEITCPGTLGGFELAAAANQVFAHVETSDRNGQWSHVVLRVSPQGDDLVVAVPAMHDAAMLRITPDGEPALISHTADSIVVRRTADFPRDWQETVEDVQNASDVLFDGDGKLVVFGDGIGASGQAVTFIQTLPDAPIEIIEPYARYPRAVLLRDGKPALFYTVEADGKRTLMRWSDESGEVALTELSPRMVNALVLQAPAPDWSFVPTGTASDVIVSYVHDNELRTRGLMGDALPALSWAAPLAGCDGMELVPYPDICSDERLDEAAGEQLTAHQLALGATDTPYLFSVVGDAKRHCEWQDVDGCIETMTCDCRQISVLDFQNLTLDVQAFGLTAQHFRLPLPSVEHVQLAAASRSDGILVAAVAYGEEAYQSPPTHIRFYGFDTR